MGHFLLVTDLVMGVVAVVIGMVATCLVEGVARFAVVAVTTPVVDVITVVVAVVIADLVVGVARVAVGVVAIDLVERVLTAVVVALTMPAVDGVKN